MDNSFTKKSLCALFLIALLGLTSNLIWAQKVATWTGAAGNNNYSDPDNWDIDGLGNPAAEIPINNTVDTYTVIIPNSVTVNFDVANPPSGTSTVDAFTLNTGSSFNVQAALGLTVSGAANINGNVIINNQAIFDAPSAASNFTGNAARITVQGTGLTTMTLGAAAYDTGGINNGTLLWADGSASTLDLSNLGVINNAYNYTFAQTRSIIASNGGTINLSSLHTLKGGTGDDITKITESGGGTVDLSSLTTLTGNVNFTSDKTLFTLPSLTSAQGMSFTLNQASTLNLPELLQQTGGSYNLPPVATVNLDKLAELNNAKVTIGNPAAAFNAPLLANIDNTFFNLSGAAQLALPNVTAYSGNAFSSGTFLSAEGTGTLLDLTNTTTLDSSANHTFAVVRSIAAAAGGVVDLSNLQTLHGGGGDDILELKMSGGGIVKLDNLTTTTGRVRFNTDTDLRLTTLQNADSLFFTMQPGSLLDLDTLVSQSGGAYDLPAGATFNLPKETTMTGTTVTISDAAASFNAPQLGNIDNSFINLSGGAQLALPNVTTYTGTGFSSGTFLSAQGTNSLLDLSAVQTIDSAVNHTFAVTRTIHASDQGKIDLSSVSTLKGGTGDDTLRILVESSGLVDLSALQSVSTGNVVFDIEAEGSLLLGDFTVTGNTTFNINDATSSVDVAGSLLLDSGSKFNVATAGGISVGGNFSFAAFDETAFTAVAGTLTMDGAGTYVNPQYLEVGGEDLGLPLDITDPTVVPGTSGNFAIGQLIVGQETQSTVVNLLDAIDNGNRNSLESLYLPGFGGDGLQILGGSTLIIDSINVYVFLDEQWLNLNTQFTGGVNQISLDSLTNNPAADGFIVIPEPASLCLLIMGGLTFLKRRQA